MARKEDRRRRSHVDRHIRDRHGGLLADVAFRRPQGCPVQRTRVRSPQQNFEHGAEGGESRVATLSAPGGGTGTKAVGESVRRPHSRWRARGRGPPDASASSVRVAKCEEHESVGV